MSSTDSHSQPIRVRWWPAALIVGVAAVRLVMSWRNPEIARQEQVMRTAGVGLVASALLLVWVLFFSRLPRGVRWRILGGFVGLVAVGAALFRFVGVSGDLVPIFEPRWKSRPALSAEGARSSSTTNLAIGEGASFSQFLGNRRDGVIDGVRLDPDWASRAPTLMWRTPLGSGWGGFAIVGNLALTQEQEGEEELVSCFELATGQRRWVHRDAARYDNPIGGIGPRATPTVVSNRVYTLGATGWLNCLDLKDGRVLWQTNVTEGRAAKDLVWGLSSSPLVWKDRVIVAPLGRTNTTSLMAFDALTGAGIWNGGNADPHYSSARVETVRGVAQLLTFTGEGAAGHDPETGARLWEHPWKKGHPHVTDPRVVDGERGRILVSSGYGTGSQLIEVTRGADGAWSVSQVVWRSMRLKSKFANIILQGRYGYGLDDGKLVCLDLEDGSRRWEGERYGHGQLLEVSGLLLLTAENGEVVLVDASPEGFRERAKFAAVTGKTWNPPALAGDVLVVRNDREAAAFRLPVQH